MQSGTLNGPATIPGEWIALFKPESLDRIRSNAGRLASQIAMRKIERLSRRQALMGAEGVL